MVNVQVVINRAQQSLLPVLILLALDYLLELLLAAGDNSYIDPFIMKLRMLLKFIIVNLGSGALP